MPKWNRDKLSLLAVFAHPDDETFRPGGTLALLARYGVRVQVLTATRGEAGARGNPPVCTPEELPAVREAELRCACDCLEIQPPYILDYPDGGLAEVGIDKLASEVLNMLHPSQHLVMLSFGPDGLSGHPDHIAIGQAAQEAYRRAPEVTALYTLAVPLSVAQALEMRQVRAVPEEKIALRVDVSSVWEKKLAAIHCHVTQSDSTPLLRAAEERQRLFFGREYFGRAAQRYPNLDFLPEVLKDHLL